MDNSGFNNKFILPQMSSQGNEVHQQSMNEPMPMPPSSWNLSSMPWELVTTRMEPGTVMEFTAPPITERKWQLHQKRKSDIPMTIPPKQFISEEKITAHFNGLHISSDYIQSSISTTSTTSGNATDTSASTTGKCFTNLSYEDYQVTAKELEQKLLNANRITVCDEIRKLTNDQQKLSFLPDALMHRIAKPCTALVLWQPPPILEMLKQQNEPSTSRAHKTFRNENNMPCKMTGRDDIEDDAEIDDFFDNNNTYSVDFNTLKADSMDEDL